jgi:hypothetical protein
MPAIRWGFTVKAYDSPPRTPPQTCFIYLDDGVDDATAITALTAFANTVSNGKLMSISKQAWAVGDQSIPNTDVLTANTGTDRVDLNSKNATVTPNIITRISIPLMKHNVTDDALIAALVTLSVVAIDGSDPGIVFKINRNNVSPGAAI